MYGEAAMDTLTTHYRALAPQLDFTQLPLWEVYVSAAALATMEHWGLEPDVEAERRRGTTQFLERAAAELLSQAS